MVLAVDDLNRDLGRSSSEISMPWVQFQVMLWCWKYWLSWMLCISKAPHLLLHQRPINWFFVAAILTIHQWMAIILINVSLWCIDELWTTFAAAARHQSACCHTSFHLTTVQSCYTGNILTEGHHSHYCTSIMHWWVVNNFCRSRNARRANRNWIEGELKWSGSGMERAWKENGSETDWTQIENDLKMKWKLIEVKWKHWSEMKAE